MENENKPQISLKDTTEVPCSCGSNIFIPAINMRKVSALFTGTGKEEYIPVQVVVCLKCSRPFERPSIITPA